MPGHRHVLLDRRFVDLLPRASRGGLAVPRGGVTPFVHNGHGNWFRYLQMTRQVPEHDWVQKQKGIFHQVMTAPMSESSGEGTTADGKVKLSLSIIEDLKSKGFSQSDIARMYGVSRQYVSWIKRYYGGRLTPREQALEHFPFKVSAIQSQTSPYRRLRDHAEYVMTGGIGMSADKLSRLRAFYRKLRQGDLVVEFDPATPPIPGVSNKGGWSLQPRQESDGDLLIRVNEHTELTDEGRTLWRFPLVDP